MRPGDEACNVGLYVQYVFCAWIVTDDKPILNSLKLLNWTFVQSSDNLTGDPVII